MKGCRRKTLEGAPLRTERQHADGSVADLNQARRAERLRGGIGSGAQSYGSAGHRRYRRRDLHDAVESPVDFAAAAAAGLVKWR
jgi:hypothetical protein